VTNSVPTAATDRPSMTSTSTLGRHSIIDPHQSGAIGGHSDSLTVTPFDHVLWTNPRTLHLHPRAPSPPMVTLPGIDHPTQWAEPLGGSKGNDPDRPRTPDRAVTRTSPRVAPRGLVQGPCRGSQIPRLGEREAR
jgi:hypothetical protein